MAIDIQIHPDSSKAFIKVLAETEEERQNISYEDLLEALQTAEVTHGIKEKSLKEIYRNKLFNKKYVIAESIPPKQGNNAKIKVLVRQAERPKYEKGFDAEKKVDHYGVREGFITFVKKGQVLIKRIPPTRGKPGYNVRGEEIKGLLGKDLAWRNLAGKNTQVEGDDLVPSLDGIYTKEGNKINIVSSLMLEGDLGLKSGSIILPLESDLEIIVPGDIKSGFTVQCKKIEVRGSVEDAKVRAREMNVGRGIGGTSNNPIIVEYLTTGFISGSRIIKSKFIEVKKEISGGLRIQADFLKAQIIQECNLVSKYGIWTKYLYGDNELTVGVDVSENQEYKKWQQQLEGITKSLEDTKTKNHGILRKEKTIRDMAKRMPKNPKIKDELQRLNELTAKIKKLNIIRDEIQERLDKHFDSMYVGGSPFILVEMGFTKTLSRKEKVKHKNLITIREARYDKTLPLITGIYTIESTGEIEQVFAKPKFNISDINSLTSKYEDAAKKDPQPDEEDSA